MLPCCIFCTALDPAWNYLLYLFDCLHGLKCEIKRVQLCLAYHWCLSPASRKAPVTEQSLDKYLWGKWINKQITRNSTVSFIPLSLVWDPKSQDPIAKYSSSDAMHSFVWTWFSLLGLYVWLELSTWTYCLFQTQFEGREAIPTGKSGFPMLSVVQNCKERERMSTPCH